MSRRALLACALAAVAAAVPVGARAAGLKLVAVVAARGVHVPNDRALRAYAARPWPRWGLAPGTLTPHGAQLMSAFGAYYRVRYARTGLFDPSGCKVDAEAYAGALPADRASAQALLDGFAPGCSPIAASASPAPNPTVTPVPESENAYGMSLEDRRALERLDALLDCASSGCRRVSTLASLRERVEVGAEATAALRMEYDDGLPGAHAGWGHLDHSLLVELTHLSVLRQRIDDRAAPAARANASNLAAKLLETLQRAPQRSRFVAFVASAGDLAALGGLLGASWTLPDGQTDDIPPGGALIFELHEADRRGGEPFVRTFFVAQPDDSMRRAGASPIVPVIEAPVRPSGCETNDCPLHVFEAATRAALDPRPR